jgi:hypothetical protein
MERTTDAYNTLLGIYFNDGPQTHTHTDPHVTRDTVVSIATSYGLDDIEVGVRVPVDSIIFCSSRRPDRLWGPPNLLSNGHWRLFPRG